MEPYLEVIGKEWRDQAKQLAGWAYDHLVNRKEVWGQYMPVKQRKTTPSGRVHNALTLPQRDRRGEDVVTLDKLERHFRGRDVGHLIGLHSTSREGTSRWLGIDIDLHDVDDVDAAERGGRNLAAATAWWRALRDRGLDPLLLDSNGKGGYHLLVLFSQPYETPAVYGLGSELVADFEKHNLDRKPELFPRQPHLNTQDKVGNWLRLPGRHHTRDHFTRVWSGDEWLDEPWLEGNGAVAAMLSTRLSPLPGFVKTKKTGPAFREVGPKPRRKAKKPGARVCVDIDGVLARYDRFEGLDHFGEPLPGAVRFTRDLSKIAEVVIFTSRCSPEEHGESGVERLKAAVQTWLDAHAFAYSGIYVGRGKPLASAFIDDRAVACRPQEAGEAAYIAALERARDLCGRRAKRRGKEADLALVAGSWEKLPAKVRAEIVARVKKNQRA